MYLASLINRAPGREPNMVEEKTFFSSMTILHSQAAPCPRDRCGHTCFPSLYTAVPDRQPSATWQSLLTMPEAINFSGLRTLARAGWELSSTLQTAQLDQEKSLPKHLNRFTVQHFPSLHNSKKKMYHWLPPDLKLKGCPSLLRCLPFNLACFPFSSAAITMSTNSSVESIFTGGNRLLLTQLAPETHSNSLCIYTSDSSSRTRKGGRAGAQGPGIRSQQARPPGSQTGVHPPAPLLYRALAWLLATRGENSEYMAPNICS